jgi:lipopolysaccharide transport system ATP-binding protein
MSGALRAEKIGKRYRLGARTVYHRSLREAIARTATAPFRGLRQLRERPSGTRRESPNMIWALRDISFELAPGEALGILGKNGAGKSTLLKILSRITEPTAGYADVYGRLGTLLEVGTGFHPELTGRENIYLNGSIHGMDRAYIKRRFDEIVDFAGVGQFIDTPTKRYSSGMYLRLAFAVAAHLEPDILIVDEVLAVGDIEFQRKCLARMSGAATEGRTVLFVSHNMQALQKLCTRCLLLESGRLVADGAPADVVSRYLATALQEARPASWMDLSEAARHGSGRARFTAARYTSLNEATGGHPFPMGPLELDLVIDSDERRSVGRLAVVICDQSGIKLLDAGTGLRGATITLHKGRNQIRTRIPQIPLNPGIYLVWLWLADPIGEVFDSVESAFHLQILDARTEELASSVTGDGLVPCQFEIVEHSHTERSWVDAEP